MINGGLGSAFGNGLRLLIEGEGQQSMMGLVWPFLIFVPLIFFLFLPQRRKEKALKQQLSALRVGDKVVTIGGVVGFVANIDGEEVTISTSVANTLMTFQKNAIGTVITREMLNEAANEEKPVVKKEKASKKKDKADKENKEEL